MSDEAFEEAQDERVAVQLAVAAGLAELSATEPVPTEVDARSPFDAEDVSFVDGSWLDQLVRVQDWLRLTRPVALDGNYASAATAVFEGMGVADLAAALVLEGDRVYLTDVGLDLLRDRVDRAVDLKDKFLEAVEDGSVATATQSWIEDWEGTVEETVSGPIMARAGIWSIHDFASRAKSGRLELSPSYQRGDVWPTKDAQLLIESIVRGIPLPSVIILRPKKDGDAPFEVVDGKQRLTAILRFMGAHPKALDHVRAKDREFPEHQLEALFKTNYAAFRRAWKNATGETLSSSKEADYYFPFKLSTSSTALTGDLAPLLGKYYDAISDKRVVVGGEPVDVAEIFESTTDYKIPIIEYTEATPRQIHEVFSLYNKQGKHLNAEEIRNAVYHELDLMRALAVAAGDNTDMARAADFLLPEEAKIRRIEALLGEYRVGDARYRRTKVLSWLVSMLLSDSLAEGRPRLLSTAQQINALLERVQASPTDPLRHTPTIRAALALVSDAMEAHSSIDAWADVFKDSSRGVRWQELQLIGSLLGVTMAAVVLGDRLEDRLVEHEDRLRELSATLEWRRPPKTQTGKQWEYIAQISLAILDELGESPEAADAALRAQFGFSAVPALVAVRDQSRK